MSDYGDFCREMRRYKQDLRSMWHECPECAVLFGTGTKVPPGQTCLRHPDWRAPGRKGDDRRYARGQEVKRDTTSSQPPITSPKRCKICGKRCKSAAGVADHMKDVHGGAA